MSVRDAHGQQLDPDDWNAAGVTLEDDPAEGEAIVVHYGPDTTGHTTVGAASARLGITPADYRREFANLVACGYLVPRPDGAYDVEVGA